MRIWEINNQFTAWRGWGPEIKNGVDNGIRTRDNWIHNPGLYHLSYIHHISPDNLSLNIDYCKKKAHLREDTLL